MTLFGGTGGRLVGVITRGNGTPTGEGHYQAAQQSWRQATCTRKNGLGAARGYASTCIGGNVTLAQKVDRSDGAGQGYLGRRFLPRREGLEGLVVGPGVILIEIDRGEHNGKSI